MMCCILTKCKPVHLFAIFFLFDPNQKMLKPNDTELMGKLSSLINVKENDQFLVKSNLDLMFTCWF